MQGTRRQHSSSSDSCWSSSSIVLGPGIPLFALLCNVSYIEISLDTEFRYSSKLISISDAAEVLVFFWNKYSESLNRVARKYSVAEGAPASEMSSLMLVVYSSFSQPSLKEWVASSGVPQPRPGVSSEQMSSMSLGQSLYICIKWGRLQNWLMKKLLFQMFYDENQSEKLSEVRTSYEKKNRPSILRIISRAICPCFITPDFAEENSSQTLSKNGDRTLSTTHDKERKYSVQIQEKRLSQQTDDGSIHLHYQSFSKSRSKGPMYMSNHERYERYDMDDGAEFMTKSTIKKWHSYPIYHHKQNQVTILGSTRGMMLGVVSCSKVQPTASARKKVSKGNSYDKVERSYSASNVDRFWNKRYYLFEKFDEGISLDEESWSEVTPEAVAEYIANKIRCQTVLDAFCGAGGDAIKLANTCSRVIANDIDHRKLKCLNNNAKVYCTENIEMLNQNFLELENIQPDIIYINPSLSRPEDVMDKNSLGLSDFEPPLDRVIGKAIRLSRNIVMLLPANTNISKVAESIANEYMKSHINAPSCSMKVEKIFFLSQLKYLAVSLGTQVQHDITLNDELFYVYNILKEQEKRPFMHRKVVKKLREQYGMVSLLNYVMESQKMDKACSKIQKLYAYIREKGLIPEDKLAKIIQDQSIENEKYNRKKIPLMEDAEASLPESMVEEEKYTTSLEEEIDDGERTVSYYSMGSGLNRLSVEPRESFESPTDPRELGGVIKQRSNTIEFCTMLENRGESCTDEQSESRSSQVSDVGVRKERE